MWRSDKNLVQKSLGREFGENTTPVSPRRVLRAWDYKAEKKMGKLLLDDGAQHSVVSARTIGRNHIGTTRNLASPISVTGCVWLRGPSSGSKFSNIFWLPIPMEPLASEIRWHAQPIGYSQNP